MDSHEESMPASRLTRNVIWLSVAFLFKSTAGASLQSLQSSVNCDAGLGLASLSTNYFMLIFSALFLPAFEIKHLGLKWTIVINLFVFNIYTIANYFPSWATMISAAVLTGIAGGPLWAAQSTYVSTAATKYAHISKEPQQAVISRFFGIFFLITKLSNITGNLAFSLILNLDNSERNTTEVFVCGAQDCYVETGGNDGYCDPPDRNLTNILLTVLLVSGILASLVAAIFLENLETSTALSDKSPCYLFFATTRLMRDNRQILLIPLSMFLGVGKGFFFGDFTKSYVTCTVGVGTVGYIMMTYGLFSSAASLLWGVITKWTGRFAIIMVGSCITVVCITILYLWQPRSSEMWLLFVFALLWGVADAVWVTQINALYAALFSDQREAAFSNYRLWQSLGYAVAFAYSNYLCVSMKILIFGSIFGIGVCGYVAIESNETRKGKQSNVLSIAENISLHETMLLNEA